MSVEPTFEEGMSPVVDDLDELGVVVDGMEGNGDANGSSGDLNNSNKKKKKHHPNETNTNGNSAVSAALKGKQGVCRIEVFRVDWVITRPWQRSSQSKSSGTGFVIDGFRILTNAHVVQSAVDIRVRRHGCARRFPAKVVIYAAEVDLAVLEILGEKEFHDFFYSDSSPPVTTTESSNGEAAAKNDNKPQKLPCKRPRQSDHCSLALELATELPALQETINVIGFPTGGKTICITEGVVSRIDVSDCLIIQVDSAINPGNSGGPAFNAKGQVAGVARSKRVSKSSDNIGYLIPATVVHTFLARCDFENGTYTLAPSIPYHYHVLENHSLRMAHKVPDEAHGVLITSACEVNCPVLQKNDVLTHIDGVPLNDDGQVVLRGDELIRHHYMLQLKRVNEPTVFTIYRNGKHEECPSILLRDIPPIIPRWRHVDYSPDYLILGSLVLLPYSAALRTEKKCGIRLQNTYAEWWLKWPRQREEVQGLVILTDILAHELTFSYSRPWRRVTAYNGTPIRSLEHLRDLWKESCESVMGEMDVGADGEEKKNDCPQFARIELEYDDEIILEVKAAVKAQMDIMATHQIPKPARISPPNPKYK